MATHSRTPDSQSPRSQSWSSRRMAPWLLALTAVAGWHLSAGRIFAETWSDNTGKFKVEAQFVAIQGDKVVLKKADGSTLQVPLRD